MAATVREGWRRGGWRWSSTSSNPEFLKGRRGRGRLPAARPIVIGTDSARAERQLRELYAPFNRNRDKLLVMDVRSQS